MILGSTREWGREGTHTGCIPCVTQIQALLWVSQAQSQWVPLGACVKHAPSLCHPWGKGVGIHPPAPSRQPLVEGCFPGELILQCCQSDALWQRYRYRQATGHHTSKAVVSERVIQTLPHIFITLLPETHIPRREHLIGQT